ncbi:hypothetical protein FP744_10003006 [Trichoderma asperellum]
MPFQLIGRNSNATNIIIDNILEALASLPEEDSASVEVLMLENITDVAWIAASCPCRLNKPTPASTAGFEDI